MISSRKCDSIFTSNTQVVFASSLYCLASSLVFMFFISVLESKRFLFSLIY